jgi:hypothetical protein
MKLMMQDIVYCFRPPEKSLLILGINKEQAIAIGNEYEQNAIVYGEVGQAAQLLLLRTI